MRTILTFLLVCGAAFAQLTFVDGSNDRVDFGNVGGAGPTTGTVYVWVYPTTLGAGRVLGMRGGGLGYWKFNLPATSTRFRFSVDYSTTDADAQSASSIVTTSEWQFLAATFDGTNAPKLYRGTLNTEVAEVTYTGTPTAPVGSRVSESSGANFIAGNLNTTFAEGFGGMIDVVHYIPGLALSLTQLKAQQLMPVTTASSIVLASLGGPNGTGSQLDKSGHGNNGTVTTATAGVGHVPLGVPAFIGGM